MSQNMENIKSDDLSNQKEYFLIIKERWCFIASFKDNSKNPNLA